MSREQLVDMQERYKDNLQLQGQLKTALELLDKADAKAIAKASFETACLRICTSHKATKGEEVGLPTPPDGIHNVFLAWRECDLEIGEAVEVEVDGVIKLRKAAAKVWKWVLTTNHACQSSKATNGPATDKKTAAPKRSINLFKRENGALILVGSYPTGEAACRELKLDTAGNSSSRVLASNGYIVEHVTN
jgi:hypothetical protein